MIAFARLHIILQIRYTELGFKITFLKPLVHVNTCFIKKIITSASIYCTRSQNHIFVHLDKEGGLLLKASLPLLVLFVTALLLNFLSIQYSKFVQGEYNL